MSSSIETLKQQLLSQKSAIEAKGGTVVVANTNPSPSEITAGISTIPSTVEQQSGYSDATATESDVAIGKTFFAGNASLKTGTNQLTEFVRDSVFLYKDQFKRTEEMAYLTLPTGYTQIRGYAFYWDYNPVTVTFNSDVAEINQYAFYGTKNFTFTNFSDLVNLTKVGACAFAEGNPNGLDVANMARSITNINSSAFSNMLKTGTTLDLPTGITNLGASAFSMNSRVDLLGLNLNGSAYTATKLNVSTFQRVGIHTDFVVPASVNTIDSNFNYRGSFKSVTIHGNVRTFGSQCFGSSSVDSQSWYHTEWIQFLGVTPPITIYTTSFAQQYKNNVGFKIYVPDVSVEAYKAVANLSDWVDYIAPASQKP